jgi:hypothetical protein
LPIQYAATRGKRSACETRKSQNESAKIFYRGRAADPAFGAAESDLVSARQAVAARPAKSAGNRQKSNIHGDLATAALVPPQTGNKRRAAPLTACPRVAGSSGRESTGRMFEMANQNQQGGNPNQQQQGGQQGGQQQQGGQNDRQREQQQEQQDRDSGQQGERDRDQQRR